MLDAADTPPDGIQPSPNPFRRTRRVEPALMDTNELAAMLNMSASRVYREASKSAWVGYGLRGSCCTKGHSLSLAVLRASRGLECRLGWTPGSTAPGRSSWCKDRRIHWSAWGLVLQPQFVIFMPARPVVGSGWPAIGPGGGVASGTI
jgi:hypothetical protein